MREMRRFARAGKCSQSKAFPSEGKVLNAVKRMRCSRRNGVIFYTVVMITTTAWSTPHHRLRRSLSSRRSLGVSAFSNCRQPLRLFPARSHRPCGTPILIGADVRSTTMGEIFKRTDGACADPDTQNFPCRRVSHGNPVFQFISSSFYVTNRFFGTFLTQESTVPSSLVSLVLPPPRGQSTRKEEPP